jgi:hypothetical protein
MREQKQDMAHFTFEADTEETARAIGAALARVPGVSNVEVVRLEQGIDDDGDERVTPDHLAMRKKEKCE